VPQLKALVTELGCTLAFEDHHTDLGGFFSPSTNVMSINSAHAVNHQVKTLIHEIAHALLHLTDHDGPELGYAEEEIVEACAELIDHHAKRIENAIADPPDPTATSETTEPRAPAARVPRDPRL
jgi:hypothetical protein